jgi:hypothetical protein
MKQTLERHKRGETQVIPIILRPVYWKEILGNLQALPTDAIPIMSSKWHNLDEAFFDVAEGIRKAVEKRISKRPLPVQKELLKVPILEPVGEPDPITFNHKNQEDEYRSWVANHKNNGLIVVSSPCVLSSHNWPDRERTKFDDLSQDLLDFSFKT